MSTANALRTKIARDPASRPVPSSQLEKLEDRFGSLQAQRISQQRQLLNTWRQLATSAPAVADELESWGGIESDNLVLANSLRVWAGSVLNNGVNDPATATAAADLSTQTAIVAARIDGDIDKTPTDTLLRKRRRLLNHLQSTEIN